MEEPDRQTALQSLVLEAEEHLQATELAELRHEAEERLLPSARPMAAAGPGGFGGEAGMGGADTMQQLLQMVAGVMGGGEGGLEAGGGDPAALLASMGGDFDMEPAGAPPVRAHMGHDMLPWLLAPCPAGSSAACPVRAGLSGCDGRPVAGHSAAGRALCGLPGRVRAED